MLSKKKKQWLGYYSSNQGYSDLFISRVEADGGTVEAEDCLRARVRNLESLGLMQLASAVWIPHGTKVNKLYAVKGSEDIYYSNAGITTRVNSSLNLEDVAVNVPALDYMNTSCPRFNSHPRRDNLLKYSRAFDNAVWGKDNIILTPNATTGIRGTNTAFLLDDGTSNAIHRMYQVVTFSGNKTYTLSTFLKAGTSTAVRVSTTNGATIWSGGADLYVVVDPSTGTITETGAGTTSLIEDWGNGWYRVSLTGTTDVDGGMGSLVIYPANNVGIYIATHSTVYIDGDFQVEEGSFASYPIYTTSASASRSQETTYVDNVSDLIGQSEGAIVWYAASFPDGIHKYLSLNDNTIDNRLYITFGNGNKLISGLNTQGVARNAVVATDTFVRGELKKMCVTWENGYLGFWVDGVKIGESSASTTIPAFTRLGFYSGTAGNTPFYGQTQLLALFNTRISEADAATFTTPSVMGDGSWDDTAIWSDVDNWAG